MCIRDRAETITLRELPTAQPVPMLRMADVELTSVDWLWFPYIPFGKLTIIQGNPGEGKTYFAMRLAAACTNRKPLPGMETCLLYTSNLFLIYGVMLKLAVSKAIAD